MKSTQDLHDIVSSTLQSIGSTVLSLRVDCLRDCILPPSYTTEYSAAEDIVEHGFANLGAEIEADYRTALVNRLRRAQKQLAEAIAECEE